MKNLAHTTLLSLSLLFSGIATAQSSIENNFFELNIQGYGTTDSARMSDIERTAKATLDYWQELLSPYRDTFNQSDKISVSLSFEALGSGTLGSAETTFRYTGTKFAGDENYTIATYEAANGLTYNQVNGAQAALMGITRDSSLTDIKIKMNSTTDFYYGADASAIGSSQVDFHSVFLHELTHGMGFQSTLFEAPAAGSDQYTLETFQFSGDTISHNSISAFDTLILQNLLDNDPTALTLGGEYSLGDTGFNMYNPSVYKEGSSVSHIVATEDSEDFLMQYSIGNGVIRREVSATELALFSTMGMNVIPEPSSALLILTIVPACLLRRRRKQAA